MKFKRHEEGETQVDMSPLIDMVFILLIFFMVSSTFVKDKKIDIKRPGASSSTMASSKSVRIYIDNNGAIFLDKEEVRPWILQSRVRELIQDDKEKSILVVADKTVKADKLVEVVDSCRLAGAVDIGVATEEDGV